jgi:ribosomal protein S18 acetylase RimI-like enzyme
MATTLRPSIPGDLAFVTALERDPANRDFIGQWADDEHLDAMAGKAGREHWVIERDGERAGFLIAYDTRALDGGIYVKRILVADKERGTGKAALAAFLDQACARAGVDFVWLQVWNWNVRAQAVYTKLGFTFLEVAPGEESHWLRVDPSYEGVLRMRIGASGWRSRAR